MDTQQIIDDFVKRMKEKNISDEEIEKTLFIANSVVVEKTSQEIENSPQKDSMQAVLATIQNNPRELFNLLTQEQVKETVVNEKGETLITVFNRNLADFLQQIK